MPNYLDAGPANVAALNELGQALQRTRIGLAQNQEQSREFDVRSQLERMYYVLAQQKAMAEQPHIAAQTELMKAQAAGVPAETALRQAQAGAIPSEIGLRQAQGEHFATQVAAQKAEMDRAAMIQRLRAASQSPMLMPMMQDPTTGPRLVGDLRTAGVAPEGQFQMDPEQLRKSLIAAYVGQMTGAAAATPGGPSHLMTPEVLGPGHNLVDQTTGDTLAEGQPMRESGGLSFDERQQLEQTKLDASRGNALGSEMGRAVVARFGSPEDVKRAYEQGNPPRGSSQGQVFNNEAEARSRGAKSGDRVRLKGVGLVQLH